MKHFTTPTTLALAAAAMVASALLCPSNARADEAFPGTSSAVSCAAPDSDAKPTYLAQAEWPLLAQELRLSGTAYVRVRLDASGMLSQAEIARSSGAGILDLAAIRAVEDSTFRPAIVNCSPASGTYIIIVDFPANQ
jgi:periplasmic protein TonB